MLKSGQEYLESIRDVLDDPRTGSYAQPPVFESGAGGQPASEVATPWRC